MPVPVRRLLSTVLPGWRFRYAALRCGARRLAHRVDAGEIRASIGATATLDVEQPGPFERVVTVVDAVDAEPGSRRDVAAHHLGGEAAVG